MKIDEIVAFSQQCGFHQLKRNVTMELYRIEMKGVTHAQTAQELRKLFPEDMAVCRHELGRCCSFLKVFNEFFYLSLLFIIFYFLFLFSEVSHKYVLTNVHTLFRKGLHLSNVFLHYIQK